MALAVLTLGLTVALAAAMALAWRVALATDMSGWIDAIWSFAVGGACVLAAIAPVAGAEPPSARALLVATLAGLWSLRLGLHIAARTRRGGDDPRYAWLKREWGAAFRERLFWFLQIQAAAGLVLALSAAAAANNPAPGLRLLDGLAALTVLAAIVGETIADRQLQRFRADPANRGRVCATGLWGLSRHPNYFFEWLGWCAYPLIAADPTGGYVWGWLALAAPALMYGLLVHVSGVPPLEAHMLRSRGDAFRAYQARVNAFWPGPPRAAADPETLGGRT